MKDIPRWRRYLRLTRPDIASDVDDELRFHIAMRSEQNIALGMSPEEARREALERFGDVAAVHAALVEHDTRKQSAEERREYMSEFVQDLRFGFRSLRRAPTFAITATLTLALGIGANAAIFSVLDAIVLRPLPYREPQELASLSQGSGGEFVALREQLRSFSQLAAYVEQTHPFDDGREAQRLVGAAITPNLLETLGVSPQLGRGFTDEEGILGNNGVLLLSDGLWQRQFGGSRDVIGKRVLVEGVSHTIVGVMPASFHFPSRDAQYWQPYAFNPANVGLTWAVGGKFFIGRIKPGVTLVQARREVRELWPTLRGLNPLWDPGPDYRVNETVTPLQESVVGSTGQLLWILFGCVVVVLLIGCVNVANLLLARATARERELAVRAALGGGRGRLIRQLLTENLLLSSLGSVLGIAFAVAAVRWLVAVMPAGVPRAHEISVSAEVLGFTALVAILTGILFGILPALRATQFASASVGTMGRRVTGGVAHTRMASMLVALEFALAVPLVIASTLLGRSFTELRRVEPGFKPAQVIAARLSPPDAGYRDPAKVASLYTDVMQRVSALPGVASVAAVDKLPLAQPVWGIAVRVEGQFEDATRILPDIGHYQQVTPGYFSTLGIPVQRGRGLTDADREDQPPVAVVSTSFARKFWPQGDAIGKRIGYPWDSPWLTVVGVVPDVIQDSLRETLGASMYVPWRQRTRASGSEMWVIARASPGANTAALGGAIRRIVGETDRSVPVSDVRTMNAILDESVQSTRFTVQLVAAFAVTALVLGAIGIYGVMSYLVGQRMQEMGVRLALGAPASGVVGLVMWRGAKLAIAGTAIGVVAAVFATRLLRSLLYEVSATDPATFVGIPILFLLVAMVASYAPARRAMRADPIVALKGDG